MKPTKPQLMLLADIVERPRYIVATYPPAKKLIEQGLAEWKGRDSWRSNPYLTPTEKGRELLKTIKP